jgi:ADP-ribosylglycohydrolase
MNWQSTVSVHAFDTVSAALTCLYSSRSLSELLLHCVNLSGDTDSVASIAVGLATCFDEYKKDIPANLFDTLDENDYGVDFLTNLDSRLKSCFLK